MKLLITGSKGQLGSEIRDLSVDFPKYDFIFTSREDLDISDKESAKVFIEKNSIDVIINCAAYTAVDKAESEPELANKTNHLSVRNLAEIARENRLKMIHISTDYVFNGKGYKPYLVDNPTSPLNMYGKTKLEGEKAMLEIDPVNSMIIRTSWVYSSFGNNFVKTMLRLGEQREELNVISDQVGAPTYARDLAEFILKKAVKAENENLEVYHFSNEGVCSWYDFANEIIESAKLNCKLSPIPTSAYPTPAARPHYSLMDLNKLKNTFSYTIPYWKDSLRDCIQKVKPTSVRVNS
ncbi:dTDP-4-dehydrorhamnose reductase [Salinimicrobium sp. TH3]|uniref:dTDP-4-dehydrorhamnose reductase n=1 Tax=Salinimicrobium sp. TH3 TaxID=2997342 RepID=UPI0022740FED|nr:dTDP-4-dehydrorhamnose reductase [Salinimicrobium sp. TH3]MCY2687804.1 dTDP-4-dehydrorhamnose reductase [Salinimicrobium sp. TH3]